MKKYRVFKRDGPGWLTENGLTTLLQEAKEFDEYSWMIRHVRQDGRYQLYEVKTDS